MIESVVASKQIKRMDNLSGEDKQLLAIDPQSNNLLCTQGIP